MIRNIKQSKPIISYILIGLICTMVVFFLHSCTKKAPDINDVSISVKSEYFSYANVSQDTTQNAMQVVGGNLFIFLPEYDDQYVNSIYAFNQNGASKLPDILHSYQLKSLWNDSIVGFGNGYVYISRHPGVDTETTYPKKYELVYYDLLSGDMGTLLSTGKTGYRDYSFDQNGNFYISLNKAPFGEEDQYHIIYKDTLLQDTTSEPDIHNGNILDVVQKYNNFYQMLSEHQLINVIETLVELNLHEKKCRIYPVENGWLLHMGGGRIPLCFVSSDGSVTPLFEFDCLDSESCLNYYGDYAYLSFVRYEKWDSWDYGMLPFENDSLSGTYRIDLTDFSIIKIEDKHYKGIFIFDDSCIFVCDKDNGVYQLGIDGNFINTLIYPDS